MHKEPYSNHYPKLKELDFIEFISAQIEDYRNTITLWNEKNQSYLDMSKEIDKSICINVEDFLINKNIYIMSYVRFLASKKILFVLIHM